MTKRKITEKQAIKFINDYLDQEGILGFGRSTEKGFLTIERKKQNK